MCSVYYKSVVLLQCLVVLLSRNKPLKNKCNSKFIDCQILSNFSCNESAHISFLGKVLTLSKIGLTEVYVMGAKFIHLLYIQNMLYVPKPKIWCPNLPQVIKAS